MCLYVVYCNLRVILSDFFVVLFIFYFFVDSNYRVRKFSLVFLIKWVCEQWILSIFIYLQMSLLHLHFWKTVCLKEDFQWTHFSFSILNISSHCFVPLEFLMLTQLLILLGFPFTWSAVLFLLLARFCHLTFLPWWVLLCNSPCLFS